MKSWDREDWTKEDIDFIISHSFLTINQISEIRCLSISRISTLQRCIVRSFIKEIEESELEDLDSCRKEIKEIFEKEINLICKEAKTSEELDKMPVINAALADMTTGMKLINPYKRAYEVISKYYSQKEPIEEKDFSYCVIRDKHNQIYTVNRYGLSDEEIGGKILFESKNRDEALNFRVFNY